LNVDEKDRGIRDEAARLALPVLVERLGGEVTITEAEFEATGKRYGGIDNLGVEITYRNRELHLKLIASPKRPPRQ
jgi:hypothetical protein